MISPRHLTKFGTKSLKQDGVTGDLLNTLNDFLKEKQRVILNDHSILNGQVFLQVFHKVRCLYHFLDLY